MSSSATNAPSVRARSDHERPDFAVLLSQSVLRARLIDLVTESVRTSTLTLVSAPAGTGKSVLLSNWVALGCAPSPVTWVTTRSAAEGTREFWSSVVEGLRKSSVALAASASSGPTGPRRAWVSRLARDVAAHDDPVVCVVDEGHQLGDPVLHRELEWLLAGSDGNLRLVLLTRSDPVLPLHRYRLSHTLSEIRVEDLRFDTVEARELLHRAGIEATEHQVTTLVERTRGWASGLALAATGLSGHSDLDAAILDFTGSGRAVSDFLVREVLDAQPSSMREVMLRTCVCDELPIGLFEALTGESDGGAVLAFLSRANSFIRPVPGKSGSYEYQPLFAEFLRARLAFEHPELVVQQHGIAARWWAHHGHLSDAVRHAVVAGLWDDAAKFLVEGLAIGQLVDERLDTGLAELFEAMPEDTPGAPAAVVRAALALRSEARDVARVELAEARRQLTLDPAASPNSTFVLELLESDLGSWSRDVAPGLEAVRIAESRLRTLDPGNPAAHPDLRLQLAMNRYRLQLWSGDVHGAKHALLEVAEWALAAQCLAYESFALAKAALLAAVLGDTGEALVLADRVDERMRDHDSVSGRSLGAVAVTRAWVMAEQYQVSAARDHVALADELAEDLSPTAATLLEIVRSRLVHARGEYADARATLEAAAASERAALVPEWLTAWLDVVALIHDRAEGGVYTTGGTLPAVALSLPGWQGEKPLELQVSDMLLRADALLRADDEPAAHSLVTDALSIAEKQLARRPFIEAPPAVRQLLRRSEVLRAGQTWVGGAGRIGRPAAAASAGQSAVGGHLHQVPAPGSPHDPVAATATRPLVVERLTSKEMEVLQHLADLHTTDEIGAAMFISVNTVRTHVRNILRKLGAERRNEAVRIAWELGLLPTSPAAASDDG